MATETSTSPCPCGSGSPEAACCAPLLAGGAAASPEALMRSRYTAYVRGAIDYVVETNDPATRDGIDREAIASWSRETQWQGLEILSTKKGGPDDDEGDVEFVARGISDGQPFAHHERSRFRRIDGRWFYRDDQGKAEPLRKTTPDIGRNEPCPCGSGKKYKRCHGARSAELQPTA